LRGQKSARESCSLARLRWRTPSTHELMEHYNAKAERLGAEGFKASP